MPFRLKNAGATYQRLMNRMFTPQIGRNVQVYVDDILVKSRREEDHLKDIKETFDTRRSYNMRLNPGMRLRSNDGKVSRVHGVAKGN